MSVTLDDLEKRYENIKISFPKIKKCSVYGCKNPRDMVEMLTDCNTCAYHRLLFDWWSCDVYGGYLILLTRKDRRRKDRRRKDRRRLFSVWMRKTGKSKCDEIVLRMAEDKINWIC